MSGPTWSRQSLTGKGPAHPSPQRAWGLTDVPLAFDPPVSDPKQLQTVTVNPPEGSGIEPYQLEAEPARKLKNLRGILIAYLTAESSGRTQSPAVVALLKQAGSNAADFQLMPRPAM